MQELAIDEVERSSRTPVVSSLCVDAGGGEKRVLSPRVERENAFQPGEKPRVIDAFTRLNKDHREARERFGLAKARQAQGRRARRRRKLALVLRQAAARSLPCNLRREACCKESDDPARRRAAQALFR